MKKLLLTTAAIALLATSAQAETVKLGVLFGFTGPLESITPLMAQDITMGVLPMLYGMTAPEAKGGVFYGPKTFNLRGYPAVKKANKEAYDAAALKRFWAVSEELTGVEDWPLPATNLR